MSTCPQCGSTETEEMGTKKGVPYDGCPSCGIAYPVDLGARPNPTFTCPRCGRTSHNPNDAREGYCGFCHAFTREVWTEGSNAVE